MDRSSSVSPSRTVLPPPISPPRVPPAAPALGLGGNPGGGSNASCGYSGRSMENDGYAYTALAGILQKQLNPHGLTTFSGTASCTPPWKPPVPAPQSSPLIGQSTGIPDCDGKSPRVPDFARPPFPRTHTTSSGGFGRKSGVYPQVFHPESGTTVSSCNRRPGLGGENRAPGVLRTRLYPRMRQNRASVTASVCFPPRFVHCSNAVVVRAQRPSAVGAPLRAEACSCWIVVSIAYFCGEGERGEIAGQVSRLRGCCGELAGLT